jgi:hypothetical protein
LEHLFLHFVHGHDFLEYNFRELEERCMYFGFLM